MTGIEYTLAEKKWIKEVEGSYRWLGGSPLRVPEDILDMYYCFDGGLEIEVGRKDQSSINLSQT